MSAIFTLNYYLSVPLMAGPSASTLKEYILFSGGNMRKLCYWLKTGKNVIVVLSCNHYAMSNLIVGAEGVQNHSHCGKKQKNYFTCNLSNQISAIRQ